MTRLRALAAHLTKAELLLWAFALGWLRVLTDPAGTSLITLVLSPAGADGLTRVVIALLCLLGGVALLTGWGWVRRAHLLLQAGWWSFVWTLAYLNATPVSDALPWLPTNTNTYSYGLIALLAITEATHLLRGGDDAPRAQD